MPFFVVELLLVGLVGVCYECRASMSRSDHICIASYTCMDGQHEVGGERGRKPLISPRVSMSRSDPI